jgi:hypothetical protein
MKGWRLSISLEQTISLERVSRASWLIFPMAKILDTLPAISALSPVGTRIAGLKAALSDRSKVIIKAIETIEELYAVASRVQSEYTTSEAPPLNHPAL